MDQYKTKSKLIWLIISFYLYKSSSSFHLAAWYNIRILGWHMNGVKKKIGVHRFVKWCSLIWAFCENFMLIGALHQEEVAFGFLTKS